MTQSLSGGMESCLIGAAEECNSCESGWTMYIASPMHADDAGDDDHDNGSTGDDDDGGGDGGDGGDDDSDDSMASDASSGPSHREQFYGSGAGDGMGNSEYEHENGHDEDDGEQGGKECSGYSYNKPYKRKEQHRGRIEAKKDNPIHKGRKTDLGSTSSKVRKTKSMRKGN